MACPSEDDLLAFVERFLPDEEAREVERHLSDCESCGSLVATAARSLAQTLVPSDWSAEGEGAAGADAPGALSPSLLLAPGERVGRYSILELVGRGAMGAVYAAWDPMLDRRVALKLLRPEFAHSGSLREQLLREAQAMARLSHPHVLPIYDVGTHGDGAFLAMKLARGGTLRRWLATERPLREVLPVVLSAGAGLAAAHRAGLVHRDFKPDNVLLDDEGALVTDFGLAALAEAGHPSDPGAPAAPHPRRLVGTPAYMAPEQLRGERVDERADQFAFCVVLYEALYRMAPFEGRDLEGLSATVCAGRVREPPRSERRVPAHIHAALLRGLRPDPAQRFPTMDALLAALRHDPRRPLLALLPALAALLVVLGGAGLWWSRVAARRDACRRGDGRIETLWSDTARAAVSRAFGTASPVLGPDTARRVDETLAAWLAAWRAGRASACAATESRGDQSEAILDRRLQCLDERLQDAAALVERFAAADAPTVERAVSLLGQLRSVEPCAVRAQLLEAVPLPADPSQRRRIKEARERVAKLHALVESGQLAEARSQVDATLAAAHEAGHPPVEAEALYARALLVQRAAQSTAERAAATPALLAAVAAATRAHRDDLAARALEDATLVPGSVSPEHSAELMQWLAVAEAHLDRAGAAPVDRARLLSTRARLRYRAFHPGDSLADAREAVSMLEQALGADHPLVADALIPLQQALVSTAQHHEAAKVAERAVTVLERSHGEHPRLASALVQLALSLDFLGQLERSREAATRALDLRLRLFGPDHPLVADAWHSVANVASAAGRSSEVLKALERELAIKERSLGATHLELKNAVFGQAVALAWSGHDAESGAAVGRGEAILRAAHLPPDEEAWTMLASTEAVRHEAAGRYDEAARRYAECRARVEKVEPGSLDVALCRAGEARHLLRRGRAAEALVAARAAFEQDERELGADNPFLADALTVLVEALHATGDRAAATATLRRGLRIVAGSEIDPFYPADLEAVGALVLGADPAGRAEAEALHAAALRDAARAEFVIAPLRDHLAAWR